MKTTPIQASLYWRIDADDGLSVRVDPVPTGFAVVFRDDDSGFVIERRTYATLPDAVAFARSLFADTRADAGAHTGDRTMKTKLDLSENWEAAAELFACHFSWFNTRGAAFDLDLHIVGWLPEDGRGVRLESTYPETLARISADPEAFAERVAHYRNDWKNHA